MLASLHVLINYPGSSHLGEPMTTRKRTATPGGFWLRTQNSPREPSDARPARGPFIRVDQITYCATSSCAWRSPCHANSHTWGSTCYYPPLARLYSVLGTRSA